jgi:hypothetical protein
VYFDNTTLPATVCPSKNYTLVFIIDSHEKMPLDYTYFVYLNNKLTEKGTVRVYPMERKYVSVTFSVSNITYTKVVLENRTSKYTAIGLESISGNCTVNNRTIVCLPPTYAGPIQLSLVMNSSEDTINIIQNSSAVDPNSGTIEVLNRDLSIVRIDRGQYRITYKEIKMQYVPRDVVIRIVVNSSNGKSYHIFGTFPVAEGGC